MPNTESTLRRRVRNLLANFNSSKPVEAIHSVLAAGTTLAVPQFTAKLYKTRFSMLRPGETKPSLTKPDPAALAFLGGWLVLGYFDYYKRSIEKRQAGGESSSTGLINGSNISENERCFLKWFGTALDTYQTFAVTMLPFLGTTVFIQNFNNLGTGGDVLEAGSLALAIGSWGESMRVKNAGPEAEYGAWPVFKQILFALGQGYTELAGFQFALAFLESGIGLAADPENPTPSSASPTAYVFNALGVVTSGAIVGNSILHEKVIMDQASDFEKSMHRMLSSLLSTFGPAAVCIIPYLVIHTFVQDTNDSTAGNISQVLMLAITTLAMIGKGTQTYLEHDDQIEAEQTGRRALQQF